MKQFYVVIIKLLIYHEVLLVLLLNTGIWSKVIIQKKYNTPIPLRNTDSSEKKNLKKTNLTEREQYWHHARQP